MSDSMTSELSEIADTNERLAAIFEHVLEGWAFLWSDPAEATSEFGEGFAVRLTGEKEAVAAMECAPGLLDTLGEAVSGADGGVDGRDALKELCNLFVGYLATDYWPKPNPTFKSFVPIPLQDMVLPKEAPAAQTTIQVSGHPVRLRLWEKQA